MPSPKLTTLKQRVLRAGGWSVAGYGLSQVIRFGSNLVMTRLLVPEMFGVMAIATMVMYGLALFSDVGLRQHVVQSKRGNDAVFLNTAWAIQILRGVLIWFFALGVSLLVVVANRIGMVPVDSVYAESSLPHVIAVLSIIAVISGFESTKLSEASRNLSLGRVTQIEISSQVAGLLCMFGWVSIDRSIWALVAGSLCSTLVRAILSHVWLPGLANRWQWDDTAFREIIHFGKWIFATSILGFLAANGDRLILGGLTDAKNLGLYAIAVFMVSALRDIFAKLIGNVAFPALSEVARERPAMLKRTYYKFREPLDVVTLLTTGLLFSAGHLLVQVLYDPRYIAAGHMLEILCIALFEVRYSVAGQCFVALGKPKLLIPIIGIQVIALYGLMPIAFAWYGLDGALWVVGGSVLFTLPMTLYLKIKFGLFDTMRELRALPWLACGLALGWAVNQVAITSGWPA